MIKLICSTLPLLFILLLGCNSDTSEQDAATSEVAKTKTETAEIEATPSPKLSTEASPSNSSILSDFFNADQLEKLYEVKTQFDEAMCSQISYIEISDCYSTHAAILMADVSQSIPFTANFPYTTDFSFSKFEQELGELNILSSKCGLQNPKNQEIINFYCLYNESPFMDYLAELGKTTPFINSIHEQYQKAKGVTPNMRNDVVLSSRLELDFSKVDHQFFYMMMHLAFNDEYIATRVLKKQLK